MSDLDLARLGALVAAHLGDRGYRNAGVVHQMARRIVDLASAPTAATADGCRGCGGELTQPATGGRRLWCSERCRRHHRR